MNLLLHMNTGEFFRHSGEACPGRQSAGGRNPADPLFNWIGADGIPASAGMTEFLLRAHSLNVARHLISETNVCTEREILKTCKSVAKPLHRFGVHRAPRMRGEFPASPPDLVRGPISPATLLLTKLGYPPPAYCLPGQAPPVRQGFLEIPETKTQALARPAGGNAAKHRTRAMGASQNLWPRE